jgi:molybdate transport system substrate-binding protein
VKVVGTFPSDSHPPIIYPVAVTAGSKNADAGELMKFLQSAEAQDIFKAQGFTILVPPATN